MVISVTKENYESEVVKSSVPVIVDFWTDWCGPCKMMAPVFEELSKEYEGKLKFAKVNVDNERELAAKFEIRSIPSLVLQKEGKTIGTFMGFMPKDALKNEIDKLLNE